MALTPQESFRLGFLLRCAEEGLDIHQVEDRVKLAGHLKRAIVSPGGAVKDTISAAKLFLGLPLQLGALGLGTAALGGAGAGYGLAKFQNQAVDPEEAKRQELVAAYRLHADKARRRAAKRSYRNQAPQEPKLFTG